MIINNTDPWLKSSICYYLEQALDHVHAIAPELEDIGVHVQQRCVQALLAQRPPFDRVPQQLAHRLRGYVSLSPEVMVSLLSRVKQASRCVLNYFVLPYLRTLCNAWYTFRN